MKNIFRLCCLLILITLFQSVQAQKTPKEVFSFEPGADFKLADNDLLMEFYKQLASSSDRVVYREIGKSVLGKPLILLIISNKENISNLEKYKSIAKAQALAEISEEQAKKNVKNGKAVVWVDAGLHANERATAQMMPLLAYDLATSEEEEFQKVRNEVITLMMPMMNPDGLDIIADWYQKNLGTPYETTSPPWLYHHYVGHDNNRDWFMNNMPETEAVNTVLYREWFPQIVYNHHQTSPAWSRMFVPPFANPVNPNIDPAIVTGTNLVGTAIANRLALKEMPGVISNYRFSMWWNGGMRTVPYYHNMIGILTETAHATPTPRFYRKSSKPKLIGGEVPSDGSAIFYSEPWEGGESKFRDAVDYMYEASMAVLKLAADRKEEYLSNIYQLGKKAASKHQNEFAGYLIPINQKDPAEVAQLMNLLLTGGVKIERLTEKTEIEGQFYEKGSFLIPSNQAFIAYAKDLMEKQEYPIQRKYPNGPLKQPYDLAGWTLPMQMGVEYIKAKDISKIQSSTITEKIEPETNVTGKGRHLKVSAASNESYKLINYYLSKGSDVYFDQNAEFFYVKNSNLKSGDNQWFINAEKVKSIPENIKKVERPKVGLYKSWVANMDEGWTRWMLSDFGFDYDTLHDSDIKTKDLSIYNAIIIPHQTESRIVSGHRKGFMPEAYTGGLGLPGSVAIKNYVANGGRLITFDKASNFAISQLELPVRNITKSLSPNQFFIPGSLLGITVKKSAVSYGMSSSAIASFSRSSAFSIISKKQTGEGGREETVEPAVIPAHEVVASYQKSGLLKSGYAQNAEKYIGGKIAVLKLPKGQGDVILFGFRPQFRGQSHNTYKLIFNSILFK
ncbi:MAG: M14 metallopeptidase family protein [Bacteroidota bacterium]